MQIKPEEAKKAGEAGNKNTPFLSSLYFLSVKPAAAVLFLCCLLVNGAPADCAEVLKFGEMYEKATSLGIELSEKLKSLEGKDVVMEGFMAPPLKPTLNFFVLTRVPMSICPFCSSDADWPWDIALVYLSKPAAALPFDRPIFVEGRLETGTKVDAETGFVSLVRIYAIRISQ